jgi:Protein of unknown function (DUF3800)
MYIFIDESGDLGFDFSKSGTSKSFTIALLVIQTEQAYKATKQAVQRTLKRKIAHLKQRKISQELKGSDTSIDIKKYFLKQMPAAGWSIYAITVSKQNANLHFQSKIGKNELYNFLTKELLLVSNIHQSIEAISIIIDKSKNTTDRRIFNAYINEHLNASIGNESLIYITHENSLRSAGLQAVDMFCWGVQQKENIGNDEWIKLYESKIVKYIKLF